MGSRFFETDKESVGDGLGKIDIIIIVTIIITIILIFFDIEKVKAAACILAFWPFFKFRRSSENDC